MPVGKQEFFLRVAEIGALEGPPAADHFIEHRAERENIGAPIHRLPLRLLGGQCHLVGINQPDSGLATNRRRGITPHPAALAAEFAGVMGLRGS